MTNDGINASSKAKLSFFLSLVSGRPKKIKKRIKGTGRKKRKGCRPLGKKKKKDRDRRKGGKKAKENSEG